MNAITAQSEIGTLTRVLITPARAAFQSADKIAREWQDLGFTSMPDFARAIEEYEQFAQILRDTGAQLDVLPQDDALTLDALYTRDASVISDRGVILCRMGKPQRADEPTAQHRFFASAGIPVLGAIQPPGRLEGGDLVWLDPRTVAVGVGYRTNRDGIRQLREMLGDSVDDVIEVALPHWRGPGDVFHLMSIVSPVDRDLAVVYSPLMPVIFRETLLERGVTLVEVPDDEFLTMGANVLALGPKRCLMVSGNHRTRTLLEARGAQVIEYVGAEISLKGGGGPTCLTRPIARKLAQSTSTNSGK